MSNYSKPCSVDGCDKVTPRNGGQYCEMHRRRIRRHGDPDVTLRTYRATRSDRLERYVDRSGGPDACWPWTRAMNEHGYGVISAHDGGTAIASRAAYEEAHGVQLGRWQVVMHLCNNPPCCNPSHLRVGTMAENQRYMSQSGRTHTGERNQQAKISDTEVAHLRTLRSEGWKIADLAERFGISLAQVSRICNGKQRATR